MSTIFLCFEPIPTPSIALALLLLNSASEEHDPRRRVPAKLPGSGTDLAACAELHLSWGDRANYGGDSSHQQSSPSCQPMCVQHTSESDGHHYAFHLLTPCHLHVHLPVTFLASFSCKYPFPEELVLPQHSKKETIALDFVFAFQIRDPRVHFLAKKNRSDEHPYPCRKPSIMIAARFHWVATTLPTHLSQLAISWLIKPASARPSSLLWVPWQHQQPHWQSPCGRHFAAEPCPHWCLWWPFWVRGLTGRRQPRRLRCRHWLLAGKLIWASDQLLTSNSNNY